MRDLIARIPVSKRVSDHINVSSAAIRELKFRKLRLAPTSEAVKMINPIKRISVSSEVVQLAVASLLFLMIAAISQHPDFAQEPVKQPREMASQKK